MRRRPGTRVSRLGAGKVLYLSGSPYQQGIQLGQGAADLIEGNLLEQRTVREQVTGGMDLAAYHAMTRRAEKWVERVFPELLEEIHGVAEGSGLDYVELLHLNLNTDVAYARAYGDVFDCTQVVATGSATYAGKTYMGKTRDLNRGAHGHVLLHREYDDGTYRNEFQVAGQMTLPVGFNSHGLAMTTSGQWSERVVMDLSRADSAWHILNLQPIFRRARGADEALDMVRDVFEPEDGVLVRTNHFLAPELRHLAPTLSENRGTYDRRARACELVGQRRGSIGMQDILRILSDHSEPPEESICRHGETGPGRTYAATIICPQDRQMWTCFGNPCEGIQSVGRPGE